MADITITNIPAETHEKLLMLASLRRVPPEVLALELLKEALIVHDAEASKMLRQELFGSAESDE